MQVLVSGLLLGALFALAALGLSLSVGVVRTVNLLHGVQVVLGAYLTAFLIAHLTAPPLLLAAPAALVVGALSYPIDRWLLEPVRRFGEEAPLLVTFALAIIGQNLLVFLFTADTRSLDSGFGTRALALPGLGLELPFGELIGAAIALLVCLAVHALIAHTAFGRRVRASAEDPTAAAVVGVATRAHYALTYALAGSLAALGGALLGMVFAFTPDSSVNYLLTGFAVVVLGGVGSILGTLAAGLGIGLVESLAAAQFGDGYRLLAALLVFLLALIVRPRGLFGARA